MLFEEIGGAGNLQNEPPRKEPLLGEPEKMRSLPLAHTSTFDSYKTLIQSMNVGDIAFICSEKDKVDEYARSEAGVETENHHKGLTTLGKVAGNHPDVKIVATHPEDLEELVFGTHAPASFEDFVRASDHPVETLVTLMNGKNGEPGETEKHVQESIRGMIERVTKNFDTDQHKINVSLDARSPLALLLVAFVSESPIDKQSLQKLQDRYELHRETALTLVFNESYIKVFVGGDQKGRRSFW